MNELTTALSNAIKGDKIYLLSNIYELPQSFTIDGITLFSDQSPTIKNTNGDLIMSNITIYGINFEIVYANRNHSLRGGTNIIHDCQFKCNSKPWNGACISLPANPDSYTEIYNCYFYGNGNSNGYGHTSSAILGGGANFYNILIHHNIFNHPMGNTVLHGGSRGRAVCFYNDRSAPSSLNNVHLYCNTYQGAGDTNVNCSEESCPD